jgi:Asp-tRNA(Asn)/Glu-tRNA(Gln) amidotransferase A subunit family amidase
MELICKIATDARPWDQDPLLIAMPWSTRPDIRPKLSLGLLKFDGVVMPHPPILRGLEEAAAKLRAAGHEVIEFAPYQHQRAWDIAVSLNFIPCTIISRAHAFLSSLSITLLAQRRSKHKLPPQTSHGSQQSRSYMPTLLYEICQPQRFTM